MPKTPQGDGNKIALESTKSSDVDLSCLKPRKGTETEIEVNTTATEQHTFMPKTPQGDGN